jgi:VanZ family protein
MRDLARLTMMPGVSTKILNFLPPLALMAVIFLLSAQPDLSSGLGIWDLILRKLAHMTSYGLLTFLWWRALVRRVAHPLVFAVAISLLYAVSDEWHQSFVEGRHGSPIDVGIDAIGILVAVLLIRRLWPRNPKVL